MAFADAQKGTSAPPMVHIVVSHGQQRGRTTWVRPRCVSENWSGRQVAGAR